MSEPQIWSFIGVFAAAMTGLIAMTTLTMRTIGNKLQVEISSLRAETKGELSSLRSETTNEISSLRAENSARFDAIAAQFETVHVKIDNLDRDVQAIARKVFPE